MHHYLPISKSQFSNNEAIKNHISISLALAFVLPMNAQDKGKKKGKEENVVIIKKKDENGKVTTEKIILDDEDMKGDKVKVIVDDDGEGGERKVIIKTDGDKKGKKQKEVRVMVIEGDEDMPEDVEKMMEEMDIDIDVEKGEGKMEKKRIRIVSVDDDGKKEEIEWEGDGDIPADIQKKLDEHDIDIAMMEGDIEEENHFVMKHGSDENSGFLGVMLRKEVNKEDGVETVTGESEAGVVIDDVVPASAAEKAKLQAGDVITAIDGKKVQTINALTDILGGKKADDQVKIDYTRDGKAMTATATLQARSAQKMMKVWKDKDGNTIELDDDMEIEFMEEGEGKKVIKKKKVIIIEEDEDGKKKKKKN